MWRRRYSARRQKELRRKRWNVSTSRELEGVYKIPRNDCSAYLGCTNHPDLVVINASIIFLSCLCLFSAYACIIPVIYPYFPLHWLSNRLRVSPLRLLLFGKSLHANLLVLAAKQAVENTSLKLNSVPQAKVLALVDNLLASLDSNL